MSLTIYKLHTKNTSLLNENRLIQLQPDKRVMLIFYQFYTSFEFCLVVYTAFLRYA